ncbi:MAG: hypothetical protein EWV61_02710 [Microcystis aeruginosa Ma_AC_P_19900807_S300]|nr:MAG: hypothetical protein EWV61_02710 [Microcystis aeruginosa Ma_AC_P_19900807_S300]
MSYQWGDGEVGRWGSGEVGKWGEGRINKNNLLSPVSCLLSPVPRIGLFFQLLNRLIDFG